MQRNKQKYDSLLDETPTLDSASSKRIRNSLDRSRVVIRVWTSRNHPTYPSRSRNRLNGHASLEIGDSGLYISLWPETTLASHEVDFFKPAYKSKKQKYTEDKGKLGQPEVTICLYTLSIEKITSKLDTLIENIEWIYRGNNWFWRYLSSRRKSQKKIVLP